jgi:hypothetical protein
MRLSQKALKAIDKTETRLELAAALHLTEQSIIRLIKNNDPNSSLTKAAALLVIREKTRMADKQILVPVTNKTKAKCRIYQ